MKRVFLACAALALVTVPSVASARAYITLVNHSSRYLRNFMVWTPGAGDDPSELLRGYGDEKYIWPNYQRRVWFPDRGCNFSFMVILNGGTSYEMHNVNMCAVNHIEVDNRRAYVVYNQDGSYDGDDQ